MQGHEHAAPFLHLRGQFRGRLDNAPLPDVRLYRGPCQLYEWMFLGHVAPLSLRPGSPGAHAQAALTPRAGADAAAPDNPW